jgi:hypothetical protein
MHTRGGKKKKTWCEIIVNGCGYDTSLRNNSGISDFFAKVGALGMKTLVMELA